MSDPNKMCPTPDDNDAERKGDLLRDENKDKMLSEEIADARRRYNIYLDACKAVGIQGFSYEAFLIRYPV